MTTETVYMRQWWMGFDLYQGCDHGCQYCYAPGETGIPKSEWGHVKPIDGILETIEEDIDGLLNNPGLKDKGYWAFFSENSDPYCRANQKYGLARPAIEIAIRKGMPIVVATKGGARSTVDFDLLQKAKRACYYTSIAFLDPDMRRLYEPGVPRPGERVEALKEAKRAGLQTHLEIKPIFLPSQLEEAVQTITETQEFIDTYEVFVVASDMKGNPTRWRSQYLPDAPLWSLSDNPVDWCNRYLALFREYGKNGSRVAWYLSGAFYNNGQVLWFSPGF